MSKTKDAERRESVRVLEECIDLQESKSRDYQNPNSTVRQAMYYPRGMDTIHDILHAKMLRATSLLEAAHAGQAPNHESLEDTYKDLINYASFAVSWLRGAVDGQSLNRDMFNKNRSDSVASECAVSGEFRPHKSRIQE
jgi:hypothetical protein